MRRLIIPALLVMALAIPALASARAGTTFRAQLNELNGSGASGTAWATVDGTTLTVRIVATGLETVGVHLRHIHGGPTAVAGQSTTEVSKCPTPRADANGDGIISVAEGVPDYGAVIIDLGSFTSPTGSIDETLTFPNFNQAVLPLDRRAIVLHGMTGPAGYDASIPIVCGQLHAQGG
jgi:CHRD domain-containing protein